MQGEILSHMGLRWPGVFTAAGFHIAIWT